LAKPDRVGRNLHSAKYDSIKCRSQPKSNTDRWCYVEHNFRVCSGTGPHSFAFSGQFLPDGWSDCRSDAAKPISGFCTSSYTAGRNYAYSCTVHRGCQFSVDLCFRHRHYIVVDDAHINGCWSIFEHSCYFSANSKPKPHYHVIGHTRHYSATSYNDTDSLTVERNRHFGCCCIVERSRHFDSCVERRCYSGSWGKYFPVDSFADAGCAVERYRELPADYRTDRC
jgi:hypothetical protein